MYPPHSSAWLLALLLAPLPGWAASNLRCENLRVDGHSFDISNLGGPHSVVTTRYESNPPAHWNTTYTLDVCGPLKKTGGGEECHGGTRVCAIPHHIKDDEDEIQGIFSIAGNLENAGGSKFDYELTRLKTSDSHSDSQKEGLRLVLKGGKKPLTGPVKERRPQKAVIEFLCDPDKTGKEGEWDAEDEYEGKALWRREDDEDGDDEGDDEGGDDGGESSVEHQLRNDDAALIWESYGPDEKDTDVLRLTWHTKHACENRDDSDDPDEDGGDSGTHWGFFTWLVIVVFLGIAAYLIFGSWLNYNRYGARGWDLVPHGDTIRDIPYLLQDWVRRVLNTVQGAGSRGGYSAV